jgi:hypothetical protein
MWVEGMGGGKGGWRLLIHGGQITRWVICRGLLLQGGCGHDAAVVPPLQHVD